MAKAKTSKSTATPKKTKASTATATTTPPTTATRGGARRGAGRPVGSGQYGCQTKAVRIPIHLVDDVKEFVKRKIKTEQKSKSKDNA